MIDSTLRKKCCHFNSFFFRDSIFFLVSESITFLSKYIRNDSSKKWKCERQYRISFPNDKKADEIRAKSNFPEAERQQKECTTQCAMIMRVCVKIKFDAPFRRRFAGQCPHGAGHAPLVTRAVPNCTIVSP